MLTPAMSKAFTDAYIASYLYTEERTQEFVSLVGNIMTAPISMGNGVRFDLGYGFVEWDNGLWRFITPDNGHRESMTHEFDYFREMATFILACFWK